MSADSRFMYKLIASVIVAMTCLVLGAILAMPRHAAAQPNAKNVVVGRYQSTTGARPDPRRPVTFVILTDTVTGQQWVKIVMVDDSDFADNSAPWKVLSEGK